MDLSELQKVREKSILLHKRGHFPRDLLTLNRVFQPLGDFLYIILEPLAQKDLGHRRQKVPLLRVVAEILAEIPQLFRQPPDFVIGSGVDFILCSNLLLNPTTPPR
ncbi:MAG: hypothetical protein K2N78_01235, partial [Oscillospiraceae bacterium]|nr:hypothetical protein [Oscillospiraceae bacterium]